MKVTNRTAQAWLAFCLVYGHVLFGALCLAGILALVLWMAIVATN